MKLRLSKRELEVINLKLHDQPLSDENLELTIQLRKYFDKLLFLCEIN